MAAYGLADGTVGTADPLVRSYVLLREFHLPPHMADQCSAVELDELLHLHGRYHQIMEERRPNG